MYICISIYIYIHIYLYIVYVVCVVYVVYLGGGSWFVYWTPCFLNLHTWDQGELKAPRQEPPEQKGQGPHQGTPKRDPHSFFLWSPSAEQTNFFPAETFFCIKLFLFCAPGRKQNTCSAELFSFLQKLFQFMCPLLKNVVCFKTKPLLQNNVSFFWICSLSS